MGPWYGYKPPPPSFQHQRIVALRELTSRGIPCILWGEDALNFVHSVPTDLFDQQILVPDNLLQSASSVLQEGPYSQVPFTEHYFDRRVSDSGPGTEIVRESGYPDGILLKGADIPADVPDELYPYPIAPEYILLLPQSYFGLDVQSKECFQSLVPPLDPSNADILVPKYHTFLEGLVAFNMDLPVPLETPHGQTRVMHDRYIGYLLRYRIQWKDNGDWYDYEPPPTSKELLPEERLVLDELQTEDAHWYIRRYIEGSPPGHYELRERYDRRKALGSRPAQ